MRRASFPVLDPELAAQRGAESFAVRDLLYGFSRLPRLLAGERAAAEQNAGVALHDGDVRLPVELLPRREGAQVIRGEVVRRLEGQVRKEQHAASAVPELIPVPGLFHGKAVARFLTGKCDGAAHRHIAKAYVTVIALAAGRIIAYDKVRGKKAAVKRTVDTMAQHAEGGEAYAGKCFICHSNCLEDAEITKAAVAARFPNIPEIRICEIGTIIASHCGPGTVAVFFLGDERLPDKG